MIGAGRELPHRGLSALQPWNTSKATRIVLAGSKRAPIRFILHRTPVSPWKLSMKILSVHGLSVKAINNRGDYSLTAVSFGPKGTPAASHTLRPDCLHSITAKYYSLEKQLQITSGRNHPC